MLEEFLIYVGFIVGLLVFAYLSKKVYYSLALIPILFLFEFKLMNRVIEEEVKYAFHYVVANTTLDTSTNITTYAYKPMVEGSIDTFYTHWGVMALIFITVILLIYKGALIFNKKKGGIRI